MKLLKSTILLVLICLLSGFVLEAQKKTVNVKGYYRKDGTYVRAHKRSAPSSPIEYNYSRSKVSSLIASENNQESFERLIESGHYEFVTIVECVFSERGGKNLKGHTIPSGTHIRINGSTAFGIFYLAHYDGMEGFIRISDIQPFFDKSQNLTADTIVVSEIPFVDSLTDSLLIENYVEPEDDLINDSFDQQEVLSFIPKTYTIQFFASSYDNKSFPEIAHLGELIITKVENRKLYRYKLGYFDSLYHANTIVDELRALGYNDAHLSEEE